MKLQERRAISPIIATLLLIAISVAAGIIVYVFTTGLSGTLTGGGGTQVTQQLQLQAYTFNPLPGGSIGTGQVVNFFLKNVGSSSVTIGSLYFDGNQLIEWGTLAGSYNRELMVPSTAGQNCFAAIPTSVTGVVGQTASQTQAGSGTTTTCTGTNVSPTACSATNFCIDLGAAQTETLTMSAQTAAQFFVSLPTVQTAGSSHTLKVVTSTGGQYVFSVIVGRNG